MRGGIAEKGGIRVGHRIIEINGQSVVATPHEKIIQILTQAVSEVSRAGWVSASTPPWLQMAQAGLGASPQQPQADLSVSVQVHIKTMPASTYRLLTGQEQPVFL